MKTLILGGARSGKSRYAETLALNTGKTLHYIATATADDAEMAARIAHHQSSRSQQWQLCEEPIELGRCLLQRNDPSSCIVVDCLTLWLSNCLHRNCWDEQRTALLQQFETLAADLILISNEVGSGIVPLGEMSRQFVDDSGWLHQELARRCDTVTLVVAGLPLSLKGAHS